MGQNVKLTHPLVDLSEFLRVKSVHFLSERSVGRLGAVFRILTFWCFRGRFGHVFDGFVVFREISGAPGKVSDGPGQVWTTFANFDFRQFSRSVNDSLKFSKSVNDSRQFSRSVHDFGQFSILLGLRNLGLRGSISYSISS